jgi:quercetin dioxygenase-like cupin family protein
VNIIKKNPSFEDERGQILDILENEPIEHATLISSKKGAIRGNHYHKESVQYTFVLKGSLKLFTQMPDEEVKTTVIKTGDLLLTPPMEKHTLVALEDSEFLILTRGPRGGSGYENDTFRLEKNLA